MKQMENAAKTVTNKCLELKREESILIIATEPFLEIAQQLYKTSCRRTKNAFLLQLDYSPSQTDLHMSVAKMMKEMHVIIVLTEPYLRMINALKSASKAGTRIATMPGITRNSFSRIANMDFEKTNRRSKKIADILSMAREARVTAPNGTELYIPIKRRKGYADCGALNVPGAFSDLPAGEASIIPDSEACHGMLVVDSGMDVNPNGGDQISILIKEGRAQRIGSGPLARKLSQRISKFGPECRLVAEFGIGLNDAAQISGYALEDQKVTGNVHIRFGNNLMLGGKNSAPLRFDAVAYKATVELDGRIIVHNGKLMLD